MHLDIMLCKSMGLYTCILSTCKSSGQPKEKCIKYIFQTHFSSLAFLGDFFGGGGWGSSAKLFIQKLTILNI